MLIVKNLKKTFRHKSQSTRVLDGIEFTMRPGEFVVIFGPNGCGKTTLLNIIAGLEKSDEGSVTKPAALRTSFIFQNYREALFPWLKVIDNIAFPLWLKGIAREARHEQVRQLLQKLQVNLDLGAYPYQLSAGQQQLAAILRAMITPMDLLIMDEPFNSLDYRTTLLMEQKLLRFWQKYGFGVLFVTHAAGEAVLLADRILVMSDKPARIISDIPVFLPRPRPYGVITTPEFNHLKQRVIQSLIKEHVI